MSMRGDVSDTLHLAFEGLASNMTKLMATKPGHPHSFLKKVPRYYIDITWHWDNMKADTLKRVSELEEVTGPLGMLDPSKSGKKQPGNFKALDFMNLLLLQVGLLFSEEDVMNDTKLYEIWILLADSIYLLSLNDQQSKDIRDDSAMQKNAKMQKFSPTVVQCDANFDSIFALHSHFFLFCNCLHFFAFFAFFLHILRIFLHFSQLFGALTAK
jgi:hypothetical protein